MRSPYPIFISRRKKEQQTKENIMTTMTTTPVEPTFPSVLASLSALKSESPILPGLLAMVLTLDNSVKEMLNLRASLKADDDPIEAARSIAKSTPKMQSLLSQYDAFKASMESVASEIILLLPKADKEKATARFALLKDQAITAIKAMETFAPMIPEHTSALSAATDFLAENLPTLRGTGVSVKSDKADDLAKRVREWAVNHADNSMKVAGFQFGKDDNGVRYVMDENNERVTISSKGRLGDTMFRAYRAANNTTLDA